MITLGTIILIVAGILVTIGVAGVVLDILAALGLALAVPIALAGKEIILIVIGLGIYFYIKDRMS